MNRLARRSSWLVVSFSFLVLLAACGPRPVPVVPGAPSYPEFMFPSVPSGLSRPDDVAALERGWQLLQSGNGAAAEREFALILRRRSAFYPAQAGSAYVSLARGDENRALTAFDVVLKAAPKYVPGLVGRGQALLGLKREAHALDTFEAALAVDANLPDVRRRVDVLRFRVLEDVIESARTASTAGRDDDAVRSYERAIAASPDSAFLHRELGLVYRRQARRDEALAAFRKAVDLDGTDAASFVEIGEILEEQQDAVGAQAAYRRAADIEPSAALTAKLSALAERAREALLPTEFRAIPSAPRVSRGDLAALAGIRLGDVLRVAPARQVVMTDAQGHWASTWIGQVASAGVIEPFPNHTFQPRGAVTRADMAAAVSRLVALMSGTRPALKASLSARPRIADMVPAHLSYPAAAVAVASGVMPLLDDGRFDPARTVSGQEAQDVIAHLRRLADGAR